MRVQVIEPNLPGNGASSGNAGIISPWSIIPQSTPGLWKQLPALLFQKDGPLALQYRYLREILPWGIQFLAQGSMKRFLQTVQNMELLTRDCAILYRAHLSGTRNEQLVVDSYYVHAFRREDKANPDALAYRLRREVGAPVSQIGGEELHELEPDLSPEFRAAVLIKNQARAIDPAKIAEVLSAKAQAMGVTFIRDSVEALVPLDSGDWRVRTRSSVYSATHVLISAGVWSRDLLVPLGYRLPLIAERGYHVQYKETGVSINNSVMDMDHKTVASAMSPGIRVAGTAEFGIADAPPDPARFESLNRIAKSMIPSLLDSEPEVWMGVRPSFPDGLPVLGALHRHRNLYGAFGHSHYGLMMAPKSGMLIAQIMSDMPVNIDMSGFSSKRFA